MAKADRPTAVEDPATDEPKKLELKVEVEPLENWKRKLTIEVAAGAVAERYEDLLKELADTAQVKGFRQGRAPRQILVNRFGGKTEPMWYPYSARKLKLVQRVMRFVWGTPLGRFLS